MGSGYKFGAGSLKKLNTCHVDLQKIMKLALSWSKVDFGISEGKRSIARQYQLFLEGKSKIDGKTKKGKHNYSPSLAVDFYIYHPNATTRRKIAFDKIHLAYVNGVIQAAATSLFIKGEIKHNIRAGINWDNDGILAYDQAFIDMPHIELI